MRPHAMSARCPVGRWPDWRHLRRRRARTGLRRGQHQVHLLPVVEQCEWLAKEQLVASVIRTDLDPEVPALVQQPKAQPGEWRWQARGED